MVNAVSSVSVCVSACAGLPPILSLSKSYRWTLPVLSMLVGIATLMGFFLIFEKMHLTF